MKAVNRDDLQFKFCGELSVFETLLHNYSLWAVFYERGESRKNFSPAGDQELFLRPPALNLPASHAGVTQWLTCSPLLVRVVARVCSDSSTTVTL
jgi:hypothetical protein